MVQEFMVLRCYSCKAFQVHQVKKAKKWACKVCGEKQSIKKIHGRGSAPDCRKHVQKLNMLQGEVEQGMASCASTAEGVEDPEWAAALAGDEENTTQMEACHGSATVSVSSGSKWSRFLDETEKVSDNIEDETWQRIEVTTDRAQFQGSHKKKRGKTSTWRQDNISSPYSQNKRRKSTNPDQQTFSQGCYKHQDPDPNSEVSGKEEPAFPYIFPNRKDTLPGNTLNNGKTELNEDSEKSGKAALKIKAPVHDIRSCIQASKWSKFLPTCTNNAQREDDKNVMATGNVLHNSYSKSDYGFGNEFQRANCNGIPAFVEQAKATRPMKQPDSSEKSDNLFSIDDELDDNWWEI